MVVCGMRFDKRKNIYTRAPRPHMADRRRTHPSRSGSQHPPHYNNAQARTAHTSLTHSFPHAFTLRPLSTTQIAQIGASASAFVLGCGIGRLPPRLHLAEGVRPCCAPLPEGRKEGAPLHVTAPCVLLCRMLLPMSQKAKPAFSNSLAVNAIWIAPAPSTS